ncbi:hypothetical protein DXN04_33575 [Chitinophaga silvisoli]|uniref:Uncharacterized protein n=1 Tax=Chitinophaga silvisoli TaxID=2291814 RepID=A0A3E1NNA4_9BACT|nr:hypothetical protein DXN04_33575 [Chitinophaga silvisoli]
MLREYWQSEKQAYKVKKYIVKPRTSKNNLVADSQEWLPNYKRNSNYYLFELVKRIDIYV